MASVLKNFTFPKLESALSWDKWLDGRIWQLTAGEDFKIKIVSLRSVAAIKARKKGGRVRTNVRGNTVVLQFIPKTGRKKRE